MWLGGSCSKSISLRGIYVQILRQKFFSAPSEDSSWLASKGFRCCWATLVPCCYHLAFWAWRTGSKLPQSSDLFLATTRSWYETVTFCHRRNWNFWHVPPLLCDSLCERWWWHPQCHIALNTRRHSIFGLRIAEGWKLCPVLEIAVFVDYPILYIDVHGRLGISLLDHQLSKEDLHWSKSIELSNRAPCTSHLQIDFQNMATNVCCRIGQSQRDQCQWTIIQNYCYFCRTCKRSAVCVLIYWHMVQWEPQSLVMGHCASYVNPL